MLTFGIDTITADYLFNQKFTVKLDIQNLFVLVNLDTLFVEI